MRVLIAAYECGSTVGSEGGHSWAWMREVARRGHRVWLLTQPANRASIESGLAALGPGLQVETVYAEVSDAQATLVRRLRPYGPRRSLQHDYLHYTLWQHAALRAARELHARVGLDLIHQVSISTLRVPSLLGRIGPPFVISPASGGERAPWPLRRGFGPRGQLIELVRDLSNATVALDPRLRRMFAEAARLEVTTAETLALVPARYRAKAKVKFSVGIDPEVLAAHAPRPARAHGACRWLYVGRLLYLKGMHQGLHAFAQALREHPAMTLTLIGDGPQRARWERLAQRLGIAGQLSWTGQISRAEVLRRYPDHDALLFPSLRDSGGNAMVEAMACGLPVVCLRLGGPGSLIDEGYGRAVPARGRSSAAVTRDLALAMVELAADPALRARLGAAARERAQRCAWPLLAEDLYADLERALEPGPPPTAPDRGPATA